MSIIDKKFLHGVAALIFTACFSACGGDGSVPPNDNGELPGAVPPSASAPENPRAPHQQAVYAWLHANAEANGSTPVADANVRASTHYRVRVAPQSNATDMQSAFTYMSLPRSGGGKLRYSHEDGAEFADLADATMSWSTFIYNEDVWLEVDLLDMAPLEDVSQITLRPTTLDFDKQLVDADTLRIRVPHSADGYRFSVEFDADLMTSYSDQAGASGSLSEDASGVAIHTEPRNALMIFAGPSLSTAEQDALIPDADDGSIYYPPEGEINYLHLVTAKVIYFKPGTYYFPWNYHAYLASAVNWVYVAPGAYVKGALQFRNANSAYKITGYGVLSGEKYEYEPDTDSANGHLPYSHRLEAKGDCHDGCVRMLQFASSETPQTLTLHGITINEPPYHSFVVFGDEDSFVTDVAHYKQVGGWYWQTDGIELYQGGSMRNSFFHANDDVFKLYHSDIRVDKVVVWKVENGPVFQWGWVPRSISNISASNIDIIHNRLFWKDQKHNTCILNSAKHWQGDHRANPSSTIRNLTLQNIRSEGMNLCAMRFYPLSNWENIHVDGLYIEAWNAMATESQQSLLLAEWNPQQDLRPTLAPVSGLILENYVVGKEPVRKSDESWRSGAIGRLNFDGLHWDGWDAYSDLAGSCQSQNLHFDDIAQVVVGAEAVALSGSASSGLPLSFSVISGGASIDGNLLTGVESGLATVAAVQTGNDSYCAASVSRLINVTAEFDPSVEPPEGRWVAGTFSDWNLGLNPMSWDGDAYVYRAIAFIDVGEHRLKFADTNNWTGDDWGNAVGASGTAQLATGGAPDISFTVDEAGEYLISFNPYTLDYSIALATP